MKQILVSKQIAYGAKVGGGTISGIKEIDLLDTGAIALFAEDNTFLQTTNIATLLSDRKKFYIAVGNQVNTGSKTLITVPIPRIGTDYKKQIYVAPVKCVKYVGYDGTTVGTALNYPTLVTNDEAQIKVTDTTLGLRTFATDVKRYNTQVKSGDTAALITQRLVNQINNDPDSIVVAAGVSTYTGISLTAKVNNATFKVSVSGILANATIVEAEASSTGNAVAGVAVNPTFGEGTSDQILALEDAYSVERGNTSKVYNPTLWYSNTSLVISGLTYDVYTFTWNGRRTSALGGQDTYSQEVKVCLPLGGTTPKTAFETIMVEIFGGVASTSDVETGS